MPDTAKDVLDRLCFPPTGTAVRPRQLTLTGGLDTFRAGDLSVNVYGHIIAVADVLVSGPHKGHVVGTDDKGRTWVFPQEMLWPLDRPTGADEEESE